MPYERIQTRAVSSLACIASSLRSLAIDGEASSTKDITL
jgi:hypothetical protein